MSWLDLFVEARGRGQRFIATDDGTYEVPPLSRPLVLRCDNCGAPLDAACTCAVVCGLTGPIGRPLNPACAAEHHHPGRHTCRFCGVTQH
jgi:hypothetical protein